MLADNIVYLKKEQPELYEAINNREKKQLTHNVIIEETKNNYKTIKIKNKDRELYLHSKYDPLRDAESIIDQLAEREKINDQTHVVFFGLGLGHHIDVFVNRYPQNEFSIYEPSIDVLSAFLDQVSLNHWPLKQLKTIQCDNGGTDINAFFNHQMTGENSQSIICELPPYKIAFDEAYQLFLNRFSVAIKNKRNSILTNYAFKKRWIINSVINFEEVLKTPNILMENKGVFKDKTAILVSAGPSLDYEIENLKLIKEKGLAYIFSVGSAINTLIDHDLYPDAMCTYDPQEINQIAFTKVNELGIVSIPMIFGSSVGFETLQKYQGPKYNMITSQDTVSNYFLKAKEEQNLKIVNDAPTIAVMTLELLYKLDFGEIILVGQNFAYLDQKHYAKGIANQVIIDEKNDEHLIKTLDVSGNEVFTNESLFSMKKQMEAYISFFGVPVINTTVGGANIAGSTFVPLSELMEQRLVKRILNGTEFENIRQTDFYDKGYLKTQFDHFIKAYETYQRLLSLLNQQLNKMSELVTKRNTKQAVMMFRKFDSGIVELETNDFAKVLAIPMNRIEYDLLVLKVQRLKNEKNDLKKLTELVACFEVVINLLYSDSQLNQQLVERLKNTIEENIIKD
nr:6-hydroxymethylpterin diphosphokinase MptE-like protein [uncultured Acetobacterium sp.]